MDELAIKMYEVAFRQIRFKPCTERKSALFTQYGQFGQIAASLWIMDTRSLVVIHNGHRGGEAATKRPACLVNFVRQCFGDIPRWRLNWFDK